jgi:hypothetical protein
MSKLAYSAKYTRFASHNIYREKGDGGICKKRKTPNPDDGTLRWVV